MLVVLTLQGATQNSKQQTSYKTEETQEKWDGDETDWKIQGTGAQPREGVDGDGDGGQVGGDGVGGWRVIFTKLK